MITGTTNNSRLSELKKYVVNVPFTQQYKSGGGWNSDGVDYSNSPDTNYVVYYINGIQYIDITSNDLRITKFTLTPNSDINFSNKIYIKNPNKEKITNNPKIINDVFIKRNDLSAFEKNYRLEYIKNLSDLLTYAGGNYFKIVNNT